MTPAMRDGPHMRTVWQRLAAQIRRGSQDEIGPHVTEQLPLFISDELSGVDVDAQYSETALHLDLCRRCLAEYADLSDFLTSALYGVDNDA